MIFKFNKENITNNKYEVKIRRWEQPNGARSLNNEGKPYTVVLIEFFVGEEPILCWTLYSKDCALILGNMLMAEKMNDMNLDRQPQLNKFLGVCKNGETNTNKNNGLV